MKQLLLVISGWLIVAVGVAQQKSTQWLDVAATVGNNQGSAAIAYVYNWNLGKKQRWQIGVGARLTSTLGTKIDYTTAPAKLARSTTLPFVIVFADQQTQNWDTLTVQRPFTNSLNLTANFAYRFSNKWQAGCNIDVVGATVGRTSAAILTSNGVTTTEAAAKPTFWNVLLTGDNDLGSLNSEFFVTYAVSKRIAVRALYQFLFTEYKTTSIYQTAPDGTQVTRFRNKANNVGIGISYVL